MFAFASAHGEVEEKFARAGAQITEDKVPLSVV